MGENVFCIVSFAGHMLSNWKSDDCRSNQDEVHRHENGLQLAHDLRKCGGQNAVTDDPPKEHRVNDAIAWSPFTVARNDDTISYQPKFRNRSDCLTLSRTLTQNHNQYCKVLQPNRECSNTRPRSSKHFSSLVKRRNASWTSQFLSYNTAIQLPKCF